MVKFSRFTIEHRVNFILQPWQFCFMILASWVHSEQQKIIEFYQAELEAVMKAQGKKRLLLTDDQRRLLAVKGKSLGPKNLDGTDHHCHTRYDPALASNAGGTEMELL